MNGCRNWGFHWNTGGSSSNPCADTYMGSEAFSEVENRNVRDFLLANKDQIKFYNNLHSYRLLQHWLSVKDTHNHLLNSQLILLPWGWGYDLPDNIDDLTRVILWLFSPVPLGLDFILPTPLHPVTFWQHSYFNAVLFEDFWACIAGRIGCNSASCEFLLNRVITPFPQMANLGHDALKAVHNKEYEVISLGS